MADQEKRPPTTSAEGEERVIAAFPATGKSFVAAHDHRFIDSDSSRFSWGPDGDRHPNWPSNYIAHIRSALANGDRVLVSTHGEVRKALVDAGIPFTLVYPKRSLRDEYRARMEKRGSPPGLIAKVIDELWCDALSECVNQQGCEHIVLGPGQYLADVLPATPENPPQVDGAEERWWLYRVPLHEHAALVYGKSWSDWFSVRSCHVPELLAKDGCELREVCPVSELTAEQDRAEQAESNLTAAREDALSDDLTEGGQRIPYRNLYEGAQLELTAARERVGELERENEQLHEMRRAALAVVESLGEQFPEVRALPGYDDLPEPDAKGQDR